MGLIQIIRPEATTNYVLDSSFEYIVATTSGLSTAWTATTGGTAVTSSTASCFGRQSALLTPDTSGVTIYQSISVSSADSFTLSCYAKRTDSAAVTASDLVAYVAGTTQAFSTFTLEASNWYRAVVTVSATSGAQNIGVRCSTGGGPLHIDGVQWE